MNARDSDGWTQLMNACINGQTDVVKFLNFVLLNVEKQY